MSTIHPTIKKHFDFLSIDLQDAILAKDVQINSLGDLIHCLESIVAESEAKN